MVVGPNGCNLIVFEAKTGMEALQVTIAAKEMGVQALTVYAFSTEKDVLNRKWSLSWIFQLIHIARFSSQAS